MITFKEFLSESKSSDIWVIGDSYSKTSRYTRPNSLSKFDDATSKLEQYKTQSEIYSARFAEVQDVIKNAFEGLITSILQSEEFIKFMHEHEDIKSLNDLYYSQKSLSSVNTLQKRVTGCLKEIDSLHLRNALEVVNFFMPIKVSLDDCKPKIKKGREPNPNAIPKFQPTFSKDSFKLIYDTMYALTETIRARHIEIIASKYNSIVEYVLKMSAEATQTGKKYDMYRDSKVGTIDKIIWRVAQDKTEMRMNVYKVSDNWRTLIKKRAAQDADAAYVEFASKNGRKLAAIVDKKGTPVIDSKSIAIRGQGVDSTMHFSFQDGSSFYVYNSLEYAVSAQGTYFYRLPTRFSNVKMADGSSMSQPSEEKINKEF